jgi:YbbR domain-containing protein
MLNKLFAFINNKQRFGVFVVCISLATIAWLLVILGKEYTTQVRYPLVYTNTQNNFILDATDADTITVSIKGSGFNMLRTNLAKHKQPISINLNNSIKTNSGIDLDLNNVSVARSIKASLPNGITVLNTQPEYVHFTMRKKHQKRVPIKFNALLSYAPKFFITQPVTLQPSYVVLYGDSNELVNINEIKTENFTQKNVQDNITKTLALLLPNGYKHVSTAVQYVNINIKVEEFTEAKFTLPVNIVNVPAKKTIKTFPDKITLTCLVPLSKYKLIAENDFELVANCAQIIEKKNKLFSNNKLQLSLLKQPTGVRNIKLSAYSTEFIYTIVR